MLFNICICLIMLVVWGLDCCLWKLSRLIFIIFICVLLWYGKMVLIFMFGFFGKFLLLVCLFEVVVKKVEKEVFKLLVIFYKVEIVGLDFCCLICFSMVLDILVKWVIEFRFRFWVFCNVFKCCVICCLNFCFVIMK